MDKFEILELKIIELKEKIKELEKENIRLETVINYLRLGNPQDKRFNSYSYPSK